MFCVVAPMWGSDKICKTWSSALQTLTFTLPSSIIYGPYKMRKHRFLIAVSTCLEDINGYIVKVTIFNIFYFNNLENHDACAKKTNT